jgi:hypothetical protein
MRRILLAVPLAALSLIGWHTPDAAAQATKTARGTVTAVSDDSVTVKVRDQDMKFTVDSKTNVIAPGGSTKSRKAAAAGTSGVKVTELLSAGKAVEVAYHDMGGGMLHAASIRTVSSAGSGGGSISEPAPPAPATKSARGTVKSVSASSLTVSDSSGKDWTFTVDSTTRVTGKGLGTKTAPKGGKSPITELLASGDEVTVTYHDMGGTMHAANVSVTKPALKK